jgi:hypothetical protein
MDAVLPNTFPLWAKCIKLFRRYGEITVLMKLERHTGATLERMKNLLHQIAPLEMVCQGYLLVSFLTDKWKGDISCMEVEFEDIQASLYSPSFHRLDQGEGTSTRYRYWHWRSSPPFDQA